jgi:hypothetical protein
MGDVGCSEVTAHEPAFPRARPSGYDPGMKLTAPRILTAIGCMAFMYSNVTDFYGPWGCYLMVSALAFLSAPVIVIVRVTRKRPPGHR